MSNPYQGKHRHAEVAEFVSLAMSVWDRQHGAASVSWEHPSSHDKANAVQRVVAFENGALPEPKNERDEIEQALFVMLLPAPVFEEEEELSDAVQPPAVQEGVKQGKIIK
jgi:hypothetical protein